MSGCLPCASLPVFDEFEADPWEQERRAKIESAFGVAIELERRRCKEDFGFFAQRAWHTIEPATRYVHGRHIDAIVDHLTACLPRVTYEKVPSLFGGETTERRVHPGEIRKLLINMPPRHMKSTLVSVLWPAWVWTFRPDIRWFYTSYALSLAIRDTLKMRAVISSPWYQTRFFDSFRMLPDQNEKMKFYNNAMGYRMVGSPDGGVTGEGGDLVISDDPLNVRDGDSEAKREGTNAWWFESMASRLNDAQTGSFIVTMQRVHEKDLSARCLEHGYVHLNLPARYDSSRSCVTSLGWKDWRTTDGELLWPERFPEQTLSDLERTLGEYATNSQLQQNPRPRGGAFIMRDWFKRTTPAALNMIGSISWGRSWDLSLSKEGDRVASVDYGVGPEGEVYLRRGLYWRADWPVSLKRIEMVQKSERGRVLFECIGTTKSAGEEAAKAAGGWSVVYKLESKENKVSMAMPWIALAQAGKIYLVEESEEEWPLFSFNSGSWIEHFLNQFAKWIPDPTRSQEDDEVDAVSLCQFKYGSNVPLDKALMPGAIDGASSFLDPTPLPGGTGMDGDDFEFDGMDEPMNDFSNYTGGLM